MSSSLPEPRPIEPADAEAVAEILQALELEVLGRAVTSPDELHVWWAYADLPSGSWLVERDGRAEAAAWLVRRDAWEAFCAARPEQRDLERDLLGRAEARVREAGGDRLRASALERDAHGVAHLTGRGYRPVRHFHEMRLDLEGPPREPAPPEGIRIAPFRREDARAFYEAANESFAGDWGFRPLPFEEWRALRVDGVDTSLYFVAWDGSEVAGFLRGQVELGGVGHVGMLGVRAAWRGRGVGEALLRHAFCEFHRRGMPAATLGVDSANPTGATRLYQRVGMRVVSTDVVYEKELA